MNKYNTIQYDTIRYNTIQYNTIQHNTTQYNTCTKRYSKAQTLMQRQLMLLLNTQLGLLQHYK